MTLITYKRFGGLYNALLGATEARYYHRKTRGRFNVASCIILILSISATVTEDTVNDKLIEHGCA